MNLAFPAPERPDHGPTSARAAGVTLVLGPTNTGKTHHAIERMLLHRSGMIGLPLRLLAREVYNRVVAKVGVEAVALITGEEKIKPRQPRYWICTVEAMPRDLDLAFVAVDEIQLAADLDRGHTFTDRLLNRRGTEETLLIGAGTMERALVALLPGVRVVTRPRLSKLSFAGEKKLARLPPRSAIVAFSAEEVYAIAELIRRQRGGAAVVLGALSPRTRNAQVDMYQAGDVDYIVATDAIGMGLNLDVDHIAFAGDRKFDGWHYRRLNPAEFGQISGRAGRHTKDGTFGTTGRCPPFDGELVELLEDHRFEPVQMLQWRNAQLDMTSIADLTATLDRLPGEAGLTRAPMAADQMVLDIASREPEVQKVARNRGDVGRLWECCGIPDYRKLSPAAHSELVMSVYGFVVRAGRIPDDWFARHLDLLDRTDGEIDTLAARIAQVRTWTYIANRQDWLRDPEHWQGVTRRVEDTLSDALHQRLAQRFVDRRTSVLRRRLRENAIMEAEITSAGDVVVEGQHVGQLNGFRFTADPLAAGEEARTLNAAAQKALASEIEGRANRVSEAVDEAFVLANDGLIRWLGEPVGRITAGAHILEPTVRLIADEQLTGPALELVQRRLDLWLAQHVTKLLGPCKELETGDGLDGIARGIAFQVGEALGVLERSKVSDELKALPQDARASLRKLGVRFGAYHLYLPALVKPAPRALAAQLWALKNGGQAGGSQSGAGQSNGDSAGEIKGLDDVPHLAASGRTSFVADPAVPRGFYRAAGFRVCGERAVRVDILERLADLIRPAIAYRPGTTAGDPPPGSADSDGFVVTVGMTSLAGCSAEAFGSVLRSLGYVLDRRAGPAITVPLVPKAATVPVRPTVPAEAHEAASAEPANVETAGEAYAAIPDASISDAEAPAPVPTATSASAEAPADDLANRLSLARQSELIAAALEGGALDAIEPFGPTSTPMSRPAPVAPVSPDPIPAPPPVEPAVVEPAIIEPAIIEPAMVEPIAVLDAALQGSAVSDENVAEEYVADGHATDGHATDGHVADQHAADEQPAAPAPIEATVAAVPKAHLEGSAGEPPVGMDASHEAPDAAHDAPAPTTSEGVAAPAGAEIAASNASAPDGGHGEAATVSEAVEIPMIEVWRPHRQNVHNRRPADARRGPRRTNAAASGQPARGDHVGQQRAAAPDGVPLADAAASRPDALPDGAASEGGERRRPEGERSRPAGNGRGRPGERAGGGPRQSGERQGGERQGGERQASQRPGGERAGGDNAGRSAGGARPAGDRNGGRPGGDRNGGGGRPGGDRNGGGGRSSGERFGGGERREGRRDEGRGPSFQTTEAPRPRERQADPNSPFAKLAALKAQMEKEKG